MCSLSVFDNTKTFSVYQANSELFIMTNKNTGKAAISIFDINGKQVLETTMDLDSQSTLDTAKLLQGIYIITIK
jgi:hypothetical protein